MQHEHKLIAILNNIIKQYTYFILFDNIKKILTNMN